MPDGTPRGRQNMVSGGANLPPNHPERLTWRGRAARRVARLWVGTKKSAEAGVHEALGGSPREIGGKRAEYPWEHEGEILKVFDQTTDIALMPKKQFKRDKIEKPSTVHRALYNVTWTVISMTHNIDAFTDAVIAAQHLVAGEKRQAAVLGAMIPIDKMKRVFTPFLDAHALGGTVDRHGVLTKLETLIGLSGNLDPEPLGPLLEARNAALQGGQPLTEEQVAAVARAEYTAYLYGQFLTHRPDKAIRLEKELPERIQFIEQNIARVTQDLDKRKQRGDNLHLFGKKKRKYKTLQRQLVLYDLYLLEANSIQEIATRSAQFLQPAAAGRR